MKVQFINLHAQNVFPTILVGIFVIVGSSLQKMNQSLISLRYVSEDIQHVIHPPSKNLSKKKEVFFQQENIIVLNLRHLKLQNLKDSNFPLLENQMDYKVHITFSSDLNKKSFYNIVQESSKLSDDLKDFFQSESTSNVSVGQVCYLDKCTNQFMALKVIPAGHQNNGKKKWN